MTESGGDPPAEAELASYSSAALETGPIGMVIYVGFYRGYINSILFKTGKTICIYSRLQFHKFLISPIIALMYYIDF
jgi:hypothetical protein